MRTFALRIARVAPCCTPALAALWLFAATTGAGAAQPGGAQIANEAEVPREPRARVEHHVRQATEIAQHFETVIHDQCPHFASAAEWNQFVDGEVDRMTSLVAHVEQAWVEAKRTGDDDVRRYAKAPRRRLHDAPALVEKLQSCARDNGTTLAPGPLWRRVEREAPKRQAEIALPLPE